MKRFLLTYYLLFLVFNVFGQDPEPPEIEWVSVINEEGHVQIKWSYSAPDSIDGFHLRYIDTSKVPYSYPDFAIVDDTIFTYTDSSGLANFNTVIYAIDAFKITSGPDSVKKSEISPFHKTIYLSDEWVACDKSIMLNWTPYVGWGDDPIYYNVYEDGVSIDRTTNNYFIRINAENNQAYNYRVEAVNQRTGWTSKSNFLSVRTSFPISTEYINADFATVENGAISLSFTLGDNGQQGYEYILLSKPPDSPFFSDTLMIFDYERRPQYEDFVVDITQSYQFKLVERDQCGRYIKESNISNNIVLRVERTEDIVALNWNEYYDWLGGVDNYVVFRNTGNGYEEIGQTVGLSFQDVISDVINNGQISVIEYYIRANEGMNAIVGSQSSKSNIEEIFLEQPIRFPTAFTPNNDGENDVFRPLDLNFVPEEYLLIVFDRWGKKVFESTQVEDNWDGTFASGKKVTEGVYHYYAKYKDVAGNERTQTGVITVLYP